MLPYRAKLAKESPSFTEEQVRQHRIIAIEPTSEPGVSVFVMRDHNGDEHCVALPTPELPVAEERGDATAQELGSQAVSVVALEVTNSDASRSRTDSVHTQ